MKVMHILSALLLVGFVFQAQASMERKSTVTRRNTPKSHHANHSPADHNEQLFHAVENGHPALVRQLIAQGARLNRFQREILERRQANFALALATADEPRRTGSDHMGHRYNERAADKFHHRVTNKTATRRATVR